MIPRLLIISSLIGGLTVGAQAEPIAEIHFSPAENLEKIDVGIIDKAKTSLDMAAYVLSDWAIIDALRAAERRGVVVRIIIDASQHHSYDRLPDLADNIRVKRANVYMHLKSYVVDGSVLRAGAANFSASGLKHQDNDLILMRDPIAIAIFSAKFSEMWDAAKPVYDHDRAVTAMEPK